MENKRNTKKIANASRANVSNANHIQIGVIILALIAAGMLLLYNNFKAKPVTGTKNIVTEVVYADGTSKPFELQTDAEYLREALEEIKLISGNDSEFGLYVLTVDGVTANEDKQEWWCFTKGGETINTSVDATPIKDGDHFEITLKTGW